MKYISREEGEAILNELAAKRGITRAQLDKELLEAANNPDETETFDSALIPPTEKTGPLGMILTFGALGIMLFFFVSFMRDCSNIHLGGGMCGLIGIEAVVPISLLWLFRKLR